MDISRIFRLRKRQKIARCGAVIVAAGNASRMGGIDKVMAPIGGAPMILHTVRQFQNCDAIQEIIVVTRQDLIESVMALCRDCTKLKAVVPGGSDRSQSVEMGLRALSETSRLVAVHDGARPFASVQLIERVVRTANACGAAAPGIPVKNTIKVMRGDLVAETPNRAALRAVQTPQVFDADLLRGALAKATADGIVLTDDCSAMEHMGMSVQIVEGEETNIKVTTPMDLKLAELILEELQ